MDKKPHSSRKNGIGKWVKNAKPLDFVLAGGIIIAAIAIIVICVILFGKGKTASQPVNVESIVQGPDSISKATDAEYNKDTLKIDTTEFLDTILPKSEDAGTDYVDDTLFIGDSNTVRMMSYGHTTLSNDVSATSMGIQHVISKPIVFFKGYDSPVTVPKAVSIIQPKRIIITYGTNNTIGWSANTLVTEYKKALDAIYKAYPYADIIINAVPPIDKLRENTGITMQTIDSFNKALAKMAKDEGYKFLNSAEALKDENTGFAKTDYTISDGVHLSKKGMDELFRYIRTHSFEGEDKRPKPLKTVPGRKETPPDIITEDPLAVRGEKKDGISVVFKSANGDQGKIEGKLSQTVKPGEACESVTAIPNDGFAFSGWGCTDGRIENTASPSLAFTVPGVTSQKEIVVTAVFTNAVLYLANDKGDVFSGGGVTMEAGTQLKLNALFLPAGYNGNKAFVFTSSNPAAASVDASGLITAAAAGETTITCTGANGKLTASGKITVKAKNVAVTDFAISAQTLSLEVGKTAQLTITSITPQNAGNKTAVWATGDAACATVDANGVVKAVAANTVTITCTINGIVKSCAVTVTGSPPASSTPPPASSTPLPPASSTPPPPPPPAEDKTLIDFAFLSPTLAVGIGQTAQAGIASYIPADTTSDLAASWSGGNEIAAIDGNGLVTGLNTGSTTLFCTISGVTRSFTVNVTAP